MLDRIYGIASRSGLHCAPLAHETIGTKATGTVRLSVGCFNTIEEIDTTIEALREISRDYKKLTFYFIVQTKGKYRK